MATNTRLAVKEGRGDMADALNEGGDGRYKTLKKCGALFNVINLFF